MVLTKKLQNIKESKPGYLQFEEINFDPILSDFMSPDIIYVTRMIKNRNYESFLFCSL